MVLKCATVGLTSIGTRHVLGMVGDPRVTLVAGCDDGFAFNAGKTAAEVGASFKASYANEFPDLRIYTNHRDMLAAHPDLDILTVAVSDHRHADIVVDAANSGHVKAIFCEKPLATTMEDTERMLQACERNGVIISVDHTRRFLPIWRYTKEQLVDKGAIGAVQYLIARLHGPRAMMWRNGTHIIDCLLWFADARPKWVVGDFEDGYEDYTHYGQRGADGGKNPDLEPAANGAHSADTRIHSALIPLYKPNESCAPDTGYIVFENGVKAVYLGGHKNTPANVKMTLEVVGSKGRVIVDNAGDGRNEKGEWTGTYTATATMYDENDNASTIVPTEEYISRITPPQRVRNFNGTVADGGPMIGIAAGVPDPQHDDFIFQINTSLWLSTFQAAFAIMCTNSFTFSQFNFILN